MPLIRHYTIGLCFMIAFLFSYLHYLDFCTSKTFPKYHSVVYFALYFLFQNSLDI